MAACDHMPLLKLSGHSGISISVYLQDGLFAKALATKMLARHSLFFNPLYCPLPFSHEDERHLADLKDWVLTLTCYAHSCSRALKWGLKSLVSGDDMLEDVHITISSLLRASTGLYQSIPEFVTRFVAFDRADPDSVADVEHFWSFLDVEPQVLGLMVKVNPFWDGQRLRVSAALAGEEGSINSVKTVIQYSLKWCDFSDTRWTKVGLCGRLYMRSLLVGVDAIVNITCKNCGVSKWHLGGYNKRSLGPVRTYLCVAGCAGRPSESLLFDIMEDDRFLIHHEHCWQTVQDELQYLLATPPLFYNTVAELLKVPSHEFRSQVIDCALVSIGYVHMDLWTPLS